MICRSWILCLAGVALVASGCVNSDNAGPATQGDVNKLTTELKKTQTSDPDVPIDLRNKGIAPGSIPGGKAGNKPVVNPGGDSAAAPK